LAPRFGHLRMRIFQPVPKVFWVAALFASGKAFAQRQVPVPAKPSRVPRTLPLTKFYDTPATLPAGKPGELIRSEPFYDYLLPYGISAFRILYHSRSPNGEDVPVTGVVLLPDGTPPAAGWPVIAWAHDFTGSARQCAPSLLKNLNEGPLLSMYVGLGYAVVASDYGGLGTKVPHAPLDTRSNAMDVIRAVAAARAALPQLGTKWVAAGYAQGSLVAVGVAEAESGIGDPNYLGAIGISGFAEPKEFFEHLVQGPSYYMIVFLARGIKTVYPEFRIEEMLTDKSIQLYEYVSRACDASSGPVPPANEMLRPGWGNNPYVKEFFTRNSLGQQPAFGPLLLISGEIDSAVPFALTGATVARLCKQKDRVLFVKYPSLNASTVLGNSVSEQISWIRARFSGLPAPDNCS
jgi:Secretory lipase